MTFETREELEKYESYIKLLRSRIEFYEYQIKEYNKNGL